MTICWWLQWEWSMESFNKQTGRLLWTFSNLKLKNRSGTTPHWPLWLSDSSMVIMIDVCHLLRFQHGYHDWRVSLVFASPSWQVVSPHVAYTPSKPAHKYCRSATPVHRASCVSPTRLPVKQVIGKERSMGCIYTAPRTQHLAELTTESAANSGQHESRGALTVGGKAPSGLAGTPSAHSRKNGVFQLMLKMLHCLIRRYLGGYWRRA